MARAGAALTVASVVTFGLSGLAFAAPSTTPTLVSPENGAVVAGAVAMSASSTAAAVQFLVDGVILGSPVAVASGVAAASWSTYGVQNGSHTVAAADCDETGCAAPGASVTVTVDNDAPSLTSPTTGATVGAATTLTATAVGGGVAFFVDGVAAGFDGSAPFSYAVSDLTEGSHTAAAQACNATGTACAGPASVATAFTVQVLHPVISAMTPTGISPNGDGRFDTTKITYSLPETAAVSYSVVSQSTSLVVRGPVSLGVVGAGSRSFVWNGYDNAAHRVADGRYTVRLDTYRRLAGSEIARGFASRDVRVDATVPSLAALVGSGATFYPYPDTYGDTWQPRITVGESATVSLEILNSNGAILRRVSTYHSGPGVVTLTWNGRTTSGAIVGARTYSFRIVAEDPAGNRRVTAKYPVHVSAKRLISKSTTIRLNGDAGVVKSTDWSCSGASEELSFFARGVFLVNDCPDAQVILADYLVALPAATRYNTLSISAYGNTDLAPEHINGAWWNYPSATWTLGGFVNLTQNHRDAWTALGKVSATGRVSNRHAHVAVVVTSLDAPADYDIGLVSVTLHYQVLG